MNIKKLLKFAIPASLLCGALMAQAASVEIIGSDAPEIQKSVIGVWSSNQKITFTESGTYSMVLTDFGNTKNQFGENFSYLGAMISSSYDNIASITLNKSSNTANAFLSFDVTAGDYWLNLFAITDSNTNAGTFNLSMLPGSTNPVPLPAAFWLMATSILGLISFSRQNRARKINAKANSPMFSFA